MYNENNQLTREGAEQVIRSGGSVSLRNLKGQSATISKVEDLPDETWFAQNHRVTRGMAEAAIKATGSYTYKGEAYHAIEDLPATSEFDKDHKANLEEARKALKARRDVLDKQMANVDKSLDDLTVADLHEKAKAMGMAGYSDMHKDELVKAIQKEQKKQSP